MKKISVMLAALLVAVAGCEKPTPPRAELEISGPEGFSASIRGRSFSGTKIRLALPPGEYVFRLSAPAHDDRFVKLSLRDKERRKLAADLTPVTGTVLLTSQPSGARVRFGERELGTTPVVIEHLALGKHSAEISHRGYAPRSVSWNVTDERPRAIPVNLDANFGTLELRSTPSRARVFIDGREVGVTPFRVDREEGKYLVKIELAGFIPAERTVTVSRNLRSDHDFTLEHRPGAFDVASTPSGAELMVNDVKRGVTPCAVENLAPGNYTICLKKSGFDDLVRKVEIAAGNRDRFSFTMLPSTGSVWFSVSPAGVTVTLDGKLLGKAEAAAPGSQNTKPFTFSGLEPGEHKLVLSHPRGNPPRKSVPFQIRKGEHTRLDAVDLWIANCEITYTDESSERGALYSEARDHVYFGPEPGIRIRVPRDKIKKLVKFTD